ncbi:hypothetical protein KIPB_001780 [Kipferlia bialata]|uniref:Kelch-type beta propeller n=1 Tax=Kipferlia bialata TaxID=797122 RepID=A0A391P0G7_9EUKA|nr:hypothetical protein KIPB_001780 [Kipferlia bialata]|eukprot:g1780.t1
MEQLPLWFTKSLRIPFDVYPFPHGCIRTGHNEVLVETHDSKGRLALALVRLLSDGSIERDIINTPDWGFKTSVCSGVCHGGEVYIYTNRPGFDVYVLDLATHTWREVCVPLSVNGREICLFGGKHQRPHMISVDEHVVIVAHGYTRHPSGVWDPPLVGTWRYDPESGTVTCTGHTTWCTNYTCIDAVFHTGGSTYAVMHDGDESSELRMTSCDSKWRPASQSPECITRRLTGEYPVSEMIGRLCVYGPVETVSFESYEKVVLAWDSVSGQWSVLGVADWYRTVLFSPQEVLWSEDGGNRSIVRHLHQGIVCPDDSMGWAVVRDCK